MNCKQLLDNYMKVSQECMALNRRCDLEKAGKTRDRLAGSSYGRCKDVPSNCYYDLQKYERQYKDCINKK